MKMHWTDFFKEAKAGAPGGLYLFAGPEALGMQKAEEALRAALLPPGFEVMNENTLAEPTAEAVIGACETLPFLGARRLVVARDFAPMRPGKQRDEDAEVALLADWLPRRPQTCCLVFTTRAGVDLRKKACALLQKLGALVSFDPLDDARLSAWLKSEAEKRGCSIEARAVTRLLADAGHDMARLEGELHKLAAFSGGAPVTEGMVAQLVAPSLESTVFQMVDALLGGALADALTRYRALLEAGESPVGLLALLTRQTRLIAHIRLGLDAGTSLGALETTLGVARFVAEKTARQAKGLTAARCEALYRDCVETEFAIKRGKAAPEPAVEALLYRLSQPAPAGGTPSRPQ